MLLFFPAQEQAPDCGCLGKEHSGGAWSQGAGEVGRGERGSKRLGCPGTPSAPLAGRRQQANVRVCCSQRAACLRHAGTPGLWRPPSLLMKTGEQGLPWLLEDNTIAGIQCLGALFLQEGNCNDSKRRTVYGGLETPRIRLPESTGLRRQPPRCDPNISGVAAIRLVGITAVHPWRTVNVHRQDSWKDLENLFLLQHTADLKLQVR